MILSRFTLKNIEAKGVEIPAQSLFDLPEKVLQFGTGVLLRGLPDFFIDKANKQGLFNGRIVVVKSTDGGDATAFDKQDGLYTIGVRGLENGKKKEEHIICASISRVLSAKSEWDKVLACAHNPHLQVIISNTTEVGIELLSSDDIRRHPPVSFPGKLLAFLYERYKAFDGSRQCGMVIVPTELIVDNGRKLEAIVMELAYLNGLDEAFIDWLENSNHFCNSLVDRIVPGKPDATTLMQANDQLGYSDELFTISEVYRLWAIEGNKEVAAVLSFAAADEGVIVTEDINIFRELKLRLLNGTHTVSCALAFLAGFNTVKEAMEDEAMHAFISNLMKEELSPAIPYPIPEAQTDQFSAAVIDRFSNPHIEHQWLSISVQYTSKLKMRVVPMLLQHYKLFNNVPAQIALGFAAYIVFMRSSTANDGIYTGMVNGETYIIKDDQAENLYRKWSAGNFSNIAAAVLSDTGLWGEDLSQLPGFATAVQGKIEDIEEQGAAALLLTGNKKSVA